MFFGFGLPCFSGKTAWLKSDVALVVICGGHLLRSVISLTVGSKSDLSPADIYAQLFDSFLLPEDTETLGMCEDQFYSFEGCGCDRAVDITWCHAARARGQCCPIQQRGRAQQQGETKLGKCPVCAGSSPASSY
jgi:hypothetical protein